MRATFKSKTCALCGSSERAQALRFLFMLLWLPVAATTHVIMLSVKKNCLGNISLLHCS